MNVISIAPDQNVQEFFFHQDEMHGERNIPVEVNDPHHWSLRDAHDAIGVADAYLVAYNAKQMGVKDYVAQYMLNVPALISPFKRKSSLQRGI